MRLLKLLAVTLLITGVGLAQTTAPAGKTGGFDVTALDRSIDPCVDFYQFACGNWMKNNPLPADKARFGRFDELQERNYATLRAILEETAAKKTRNAVEQKVGDYYAACMDTKSIDALGTKPIQPLLRRVAAIKDRATLMDTAAWLHTQGVNVLFSFRPGPDLHNAQLMIANVGQGGYSLPDRDYYLKDDERSNDVRAKYAAHVQKMFELLGDKPEAAAASAKSVLKIETELARAAMDRTMLRDPKNRDHKMKLEELVAIAPNLQLTKYFEGTGAPKFSEVNVVSPSFFKSINPLLETIPVDDWKTYVRWHVLRSATPMLPDAFVQESFNFNGRFLNGQKELEARWKRCVRYTDGDLGEALGELYVAKTFGRDGKERTLKLVEAIEHAMGENLKTLEWMTEETKKASYEKLHALRNNIGYPNKWRDYSSVVVKRNDAFGNAQRAAVFETNRVMKKIGNSVDRSEWGMTPPTVNAYYRPSMNDINFPAGILQPPFFDKNADDAINFGGIGAVIGHELTHGFDDQGSKFASDGNFKNWWTEKDRAEFEKRTNCLVDQYGAYEPVPGVKLNGKLTLGENTSDNGGVRLAFMALQETLKNKPQEKLDGFTPEQRFFLGYAQIWCQNVAPERSRVLALTDPHSPGRFRVNGVVVNSPDFQKAFGCKAGQPMAAENACRVW